MASSSTPVDVSKGTIASPNVDQYRSAPQMGTEPERDAYDPLDGNGNDQAHSWYGSFKAGLGEVIGFIGAIPCMCCCPNPYLEVQQGNAGLITRFGRFDRQVTPGLTKVNPVSEKLVQVSLKIQTLDAPRQECMTKDNVKVSVTSVVYYEVIDPRAVAFRVQNLSNALSDLTNTTLRNVAGRMTFQELINNREGFASHTKEEVEDSARQWGIHVKAILLKDVIIDPKLQDSLSMAAQSKRIGEAKVITAQAEVESAKLMREAADILNSEAAMQIRYLEAMQAMAKSSNSKVIYLPPLQNLQSTTAAMLGNGIVPPAIEQENSN